MISKIFIALLAIVSAAPFRDSYENGRLEKRLDNGLGKTPALGWNGWNQGQCNAATASTALNTAKAFVSLGLKDLGYLYVNIDDCWASKARDSAGNLVPDPAKWPNGIKAVTDQIHDMGLKMGLYGDAGRETCGGYPGSQGHEVQDGKTLASWGVDYWKYDNCYTGTGFNNAGANTSTYYPTMRDSLLNSGRPIFFSMCQWGRDNVWIWGGSVGNSWRMSDDIQNNWGSVASIAAKAATIAQYAAPGGFNDLDMMQLGNGKLSGNEERAHFGLWAIAKSPIIMGTDMTKLATSTLEIIKNKGILSIHQDPLGKAATTFQPSGAAAPSGSSLYPYWAGPLSDGIVIGLIAVDKAGNYSVNFSDVPGLGNGSFSWAEFYSGKTANGTSASFELGLHDMAVIKVNKSAV
ncbi:glycoside hydrolase family 27 protein [Hyaloscypha variabilis F]|uniref:Alpha-galactosidase n=1 Tax=Hyaloscypha variabilis (strain UAMH 11265 / GT02V1 / F) TaxID=1149755 RepID=A0A2J6R499_HYAVF|nr:glycoside hydrolase family 27 protein [Hyaloscypha variabilis F]